MRFDGVDMGEVVQPEALLGERRGDEPSELKSQGRICLPCYGHCGAVHLDEDAQGKVARCHRCASMRPKEHMRIFRLGEGEDARK